MILNSVDDREDDISELRRLLSIAPQDKKSKIEQEIRNIQSGVRGEKEAAYNINLWLGDKKGFAVIHGLRLELPNGDSAQIDHLVIHKNYRFYMLETKNFKHGVKITDDRRFLRWNGFQKCYEPMRSPIEQNQNHGLILRKALDLLQYPKPYIKLFVLINPEANIYKPKTGFDMVIPSDQFIDAMDRDIRDTSVFTHINGLISTVATGSVQSIGEKLLSMHRPIKFNWAAKFGLDQSAACCKEACSDQNIENRIASSLEDKSAKTATQRNYDHIMDPIFVSSFDKPIYNQKKFSYMAPVIGLTFAAIIMFYINARDKQSNQPQQQAPSVTHNSAPRTQPPPQQQPYRTIQPQPQQAAPSLQKTQLFSPISNQIAVQPAGSCEEVISPHGKSLVASASEIRNNEIPAYWKAVNNSGLTVAVVIEQDGKKVAVAFLGPQQKYETRIPASNLQFFTKYSTSSCIEWKKGFSSSYSRIPSAYEMRNYAKVKNSIDLYRDGLFQTEINPTENGIATKTTFVGYAR